ncbi:MAG: hypothetical protein CM1200mP30_13890 [Pseudomonadota bacterium]|nr:MAG: hypothetical protein CM1200mP30_13890 [Pseudomonadota bacterium]
MPCYFKKYAIFIFSLSLGFKNFYKPEICSSVGSAQQYQGSLIAGTGMLPALSGGRAGADCSQALCAKIQICSKIDLLLAPSLTPN